MSCWTGRMIAPALALVLAFPVAAAGQSDGAWQIAPRAGMFLPLNGLGDVPISTQIAGLQPQSRPARIQVGASVGVSFLRAIAPGTRLRLDVDYVPPIDVQVDGYSNLVVQAAGAAVLAGVERMVGGDGGAVEPFVVGAAGFRSYRFQPWMSAGPQFPSGQISPALRLGGGAVMRVSTVALSAELTDQLSLFRFDGGASRRVQNELQAQAGVRIGMF